MRSRLVLPVVVAAGLVLGACSSDHDDGSMSGHGSGSMEMGSEGGGTTSSLDLPDGVNAADVAFAQGMIPHHGQAVQMSELALEASSDPAVLALAEEIRAAQAPEIELMTSWLTEWGQPVPDPDDPMGGSMDGSMEHSGAMASGMMSADEMADLGMATGAEFDRMFLEMMIRHHEGAVEMAEQQLADGSDPAALELASAIIAAQEAEIAEMEAMLAAMPD